MYLKLRLYRHLEHFVSPGWFAFLFALLCLQGPFADAAYADGEWQGEWQLTNTAGGDFLILEQDGQKVTGSLRSGFGRVEATVTDDRIDGVLVFNELREAFSAVLSDDGRSFSGTNDAGEWLKAEKFGESDTATKEKIDLTSPRATLRTFLNAINTRASGQTGAMSLAARAIDFGEAAAWASIDDQFSAAEQLFILIDGATFSLASIPQEVSQPELKVSLPVVGSKLTVDVSFRRNEQGDWLIQMPPVETLREAINELKSQGVSLNRGTAEIRLLQNPRDTVRAFLNAMSRWEDGGAEDVVATLDVSEVPVLMRSEHAQLTSQYLVRIIDRAGTMLLQTIPNSGASLEPFVYLDNPEGRIVISPTGTDKDIRWQFTYETTKNIHRLYRAVQLLPDAAVLDPAMIPDSNMISIRQWVNRSAPALTQPLHKNAIFEYWQLIGVLFIIAFVTLLANVLRRLVAKGLRLLRLEKRLARPKLIADALSVIVCLLVIKQMYSLLGLPPLAREYTLPVLGPIVILVATYLGWQILNAVAMLLEDSANQTETQIDNIFLTFAVGAVRMAIVVSAVLGISHILALPTTGILAGLGFGGLAIAFASRETLANIFGAGIILSDRPFQKGDRIVAGDINGWVESVGLRSTRVRTLYDSLLIVPNAKLADAAINNMGARRKRTLLTKLPITSGGTPENLAAFAEAIRQRLEQDTDFAPKSSEVNINGIELESIKIEIFTTLSTRSGYLSRGIIHKLFLDILAIAKEHGLGLGCGAEEDHNHDVKLL